LRMFKFNWFKKRPTEFRWISTYKDVRGHTFYLARSEDGTYFYTLIPSLTHLFTDQLEAALKTPTYDGTPNIEDRVKLTRIEVHS